MNEFKENSFIFFSFTFILLIFKTTQLSTWNHWSTLHSQNLLIDYATMQHFSTNSPKLPKLFTKNSPRAINWTMMHDTLDLSKYTTICFQNSPPPSHYHHPFFNHILLVHYFYCLHCLTSSTFALFYIRINDLSLHYIVAKLILHLNNFCTFSVSTLQVFAFRLFTLELFTSP